jgi:formylglycine-generating enzyme required for sulfatase activity
VPGINNTQPAVFGCDFSQDNVYNTSNDGQNIPFMCDAKADILAYLDWAGLRPLTEMAYEKLCRGPRPRLAGEYPWGSTNFNARTRGNLTNGGTATEATTATVVNGQVTASSGSTAHGAACNGIFATASTGRESSGAGFYGHMELSGNLWEMAVAAATGGTSFTGSEHGNGLLTADGECDMANWPPPNGGANTGMMVRGGSWWETSNAVGFTRTSYRGPSVGVGRSYIYGIRGARSAN